MNNNINNKEYNIKLYNTVFNNIYLKKIILEHLNIYNILYNIDIEFDSIEQWQQFKYKEYLNKATLHFQYNLNQLPENIKFISILLNNTQDNTISQLPNHIESIKIIPFISSFRSSIFKTNSPKLNDLYLSLDSQLQPNSIPQSVTNLTIYDAPKLILSKNIFPNKLNSLSVNSKVESFEKGCFPESITKISRLISDPLLINQLTSLNLVKLYFETDQPIKSNIKFPPSLQELLVECPNFNTKLPDGLKSLKLNVEMYENEIKFPSSIETLSIASPHYKFDVFKNQKQSLINLKELYFSCSRITNSSDPPILPDKLEKLVFFSSKFNQMIKLNQLPPSLTYINFGLSFNQEIGINILPATLKTLKFGNDFNQPINPLAIPQQLKLLEINNFFYKHSINLTSTHPNTVVVCTRLNSYYNPSINKDIIKLRLPNHFNSSLSTLQLQDKSSLEYLHLGIEFNQPIELSDLPINNNIKTLELSQYFSKTINLEYFQKLETIIIYSNYEVPPPKIITKTLHNDNNSNNNNNHKNKNNDNNDNDSNSNNKINYNFYSLKNIIIDSRFKKLIRELDSNFYKFIKLNTLK